MDTIFSSAFGSQTDGPKYQRIVAALSQLITDGTLKGGEKLPPVRDLSWTLGVTPGTVARAFDILQQEGWVEAEVGRGTFVRGPVAPPEAPTPGLPEISPTYLPMPQEGDVLFAPRLADLGQIDLIREALRDVAETEGVDTLLNYPSYERTRPLREALTGWIHGEVHGGVGADDIVVTAGGQNAIVLSLQSTLSGDRPVVLVEELHYPGIRRAAEVLRARPVGVPMDDKGLIPEALDQIAREEGAKVLVTMPEVHNPTCVVTPTDRREAIARVAERHGLNVVQDDCYRMSYPTGPSYRKLLPDLGWYTSSLSKTITPALRMGYLVPPRGAVRQVRRVLDANYFGLPSPMVALASRLFRDPRFQVLADAQKDLNRQMLEIAVTVLGRFDIGWSPGVAYLWLRLPEGWRESAFVQALEADGIRVRPGEDFADRNARARHAVRLSLNLQMTPEHFRDVLERIALILDNAPLRSNA